MSNYIRREDAVSAVEFGITLASAINIETGERAELFQRENDELREAVERIQEIEPADVVSKADMITLLEETEKEITKGVEESPTGMMIKSVFGVIKCKVNMLGENHG